MEMEYETYTINTYKRLKPFLSAFPDTICFINPESELDTDAWIRLIQSIEADPAYSGVIIGVVARAIRKSDKERFIDECKLQATFIQQVPDKDELTAQFHEVLHNNNAKGRRKYVRANCANDNSISAIATTRNTKIRFAIQDISSVGICGRVNKDLAPLLPANAVLPDFTLIIQGTELKVGAVIIMTKIETEALVVVTLFRSGMSTNIKNIIREFVSTKLNQMIEATLEDIPDDTTDYVSDPKKAKDKEETQDSEVSQAADASSAPQEATQFADDSPAAEG